MGSADPPGKMDEKLKKRKHAKESSFLNFWAHNYVYVIFWEQSGQARQRRCADHIFIQIYFRMHQFVVKFSKKNFASGANGLKGAVTLPNQNFADAAASVLPRFLRLVIFASVSARSRSFRVGLASASTVMARVWDTNSLMSRSLVTGASLWPPHH